MWSKSCNACAWWPSPEQALRSLLDMQGTPVSVGVKEVGSALAPLSPSCSFGGCAGRGSQLSPHILGRVAKADRCCRLPAHLLSWAGCGLSQQHLLAAGLSGGSKGESLHGAERLELYAAEMEDRRSCSSSLLVSSLCGGCMGLQCWLAAGLYSGLSSTRPGSSCFASTHPQTGHQGMVMAP